MDVIEMAKQLGETIMKDERCRRYQLAKAANDSDLDLQEMIGEFNLMKMKLNNELKRDDCDPVKAKEYEKELTETYRLVMATDSMKEYEAAKKEIDELVGHINSIIQMSISGEVDLDGGCGGDCSGCAGCH